MMTCESNKILGKRIKCENPNENAEDEGYDQCDYFENENVGNSGIAAKAQPKKYTII